MGVSEDGASVLESRINTLSRYRTAEQCQVLILDLHHEFVDQ